MEEETSITAERNHRAFWYCYLGTECQRQTTADCTELNGVNKRSWLVDGEIACTRISKHRHISYDHAIMRDRLTQGIQERDGWAERSLCVLLQCSTRLGYSRHARGTIVR